MFSAITSWLRGQLPYLIPTTRPNGAASHPRLTLLGFRVNFNIVFLILLFGHFLQKSRSRKSFLHCAIQKQTSVGAKRCRLSFFILLCNNSTRFRVGALSSTWVGRAGLDFSPWGAAFIFVSRRMRVKGLVGVDDSVHEMPCASLLEERSSREQEVPWDSRIATERPWNAQERSGARAAANSP